MQDLTLQDGERKGIAALLIEAPGGKTVRDNLDHFVQRNTVDAVCVACAATALFTLQINAPSGGVGHRVSVRGGGPLTCLLAPGDTRASLWQQLWLNVLPRSELKYPEVGALSDVLPWLAPTRTSETGGSSDTCPEHVHPLQAYWSMSRRIRLDFSEQRGGRCDLCGAESEHLVSGYRTRNYGVNYSGAWLHPLTPYYHDDKQQLPISAKGQKGGIGYRHWLGLALGNDALQPAAAQVVAHFNAKLREPAARLWCFGYDMKNMQARCWYDSELPLHAVAPEWQFDFRRAVKTLLAVAEERAWLLHRQMQAARFARPADVGAEPAVKQDFWQRSEAEFYVALRWLGGLDWEDPAALARLYRGWLGATRALALRLFDEWVQVAPIEDMNMKRVTLARAGLVEGLNLGKAVKPVRTLIKTHLEETA